MTTVHVVRGGASVIQLDAAQLQLNNRLQHSVDC